MQLIVGSGTPGGTDGRLRTFAFDGATFTPAGEAPAGALASFLALDAEHGLVHVADEEARGVHSFGLAADGALEARGETPTQGHGVSLLVGNAALYVSSYLEGGVERLPLGNDGMPSAPTASVKAGDKAHGVFAAPGGQALLVTLTGSDRVAVYSPLLELRGDIEVTGGPRHLAVHPSLPRAYVITEYTEELVTLGWADEALEVLDRRSLRPAGWQGTGADIHVHASGELLVTTLRQPDAEGQLATVALDAAGTPGELAHRASGGVIPRNATLVGDHLFVAHRISGDVRAFRRQGLGWDELAHVDVPAAYCVRAL
ncbi:MAG: beta-propeller fold lactonase family protein [Myxococcota bacterium]